MKEKKRKKYEGNETCNARININYKGVKPKVKFSYPDKPNQFHGSMFAYIFIGWFLIYITLGVGATMLTAWNNEYTVYHNPTVQKYSKCAEFYETNYEKVVSNVCTRIALNKTQVYPKYTRIFIEDQFRVIEDYYPRWNGLIWLLGLLIPPFLIYLPFRRQWKNVYPVFQGWLSSKKFMKFQPKDVIERDGKILCEVPLFNNVLLNYTATKQFSKYLEFFEIEEYKFSYKDRKKKGNRKMKVNEWIWYARFYFKQKPKTGKLEVIFK